MIDRGLAELRRQGLDPAPETKAWIADLRSAAAAYRARVASERTGTPGIPLQAHPANVDAVMVTVKAAASAAGCGERNVRALIGRKTLRAERVGRSWLVDRASLDEYVMAQRARRSA